MNTVDSEKPRFNERKSLEGRREGKGRTKDRRRRFGIINLVTEWRRSEDEEEGDEEFLIGVAGGVVREVRF